MWDVEVLVCKEIGTHWVFLIRPDVQIEDGKDSRMKKGTGVVAVLR